MIAILLVLVAAMTMATVAGAAGLSELVGTFLGG